MKFTSEIEIDDEHLEVLLDYNKGYKLDSEYFVTTGREDIENEMSFGKGLLEGGFYQHYPLGPTSLGHFILNLYKNKK
jgi:hypothetical protein